MPASLEDQLAQLIDQGLPESELRDELASMLGDAPLSPKSVDKIPQADANYVDPGPYPFTCGNCSLIVWGPSRPGAKSNPADNPDDEADLCQIVQGEIHASGACRFFRHKEIDRSELEEE